MLSAIAEHLGNADQPSSRVARVHRPRNGRVHAEAATLLPRPGYLAPPSRWRTRPAESRSPTPCRASARRSRRAGGVCWRKQSAGRLLGRRAAGRQHPRIRIPAAEFILGQENDPDLPLRSPTTSAGSNSPTAGGTCSPGGPADISGTVKGYFALKLMGDDPDAPHMARARDLIRSPRRGREVQQLHQVLLRRPRADQLRRLPDDPAGNRLPAEVVLLQPVPRVGLDADDDPAAGDRHDATAGAARCRPTRASPSCTSTTPPPTAWRRRPRACRPTGGEFFLRVDQFLKAYDQTPIACPAHCRRCGRRSGGCWNTWTAPRGWGRSSRRWSTS